MGRNCIIQYPSYLWCSWKLFSPSQLIHIAVGMEMVDIDVWLMKSLMFSCGSSMTSEVNGSGLYVSVFWNTRLYLVEQAISFACHFLNFKAKWDTWSGHAIEINENQRLLHPLVCPWLSWYSFPQVHIYADELEVGALHFFLLGIICNISWFMENEVLLTNHGHLTGPEAREPPPPPRYSHLFLFSTLIMWI